NHQCAALITLGGAGDDLTLALAELFQQAAALILTEALNHDLLGGLCGNAAKRGQRDDLAAAIGLIAPDGDVAGDPVHLAAKLLRIKRIEVLASSTDHRLLKIMNEQIAIDVAVASDGIKDAKSFSVHGSPRFSKLLSCQVVELSRCQSSSSKPAVHGRQFR